MEQELIRMVSERTGLPEDKARIAAETVVHYLKGKLPSTISGQLDNALAGRGRSFSDIAGSVTGKLTDR